MASLHFMSFPTTTYRSTEHQTPLFSSSPKPHHQSRVTISTNLSLSCSLFPPLSHRFKSIANPFLLNFSAAAQAVDSSPSDAPREVSTTRVVIQNIPWECTAEDVRALFEQYGTVLDLELSMYSKTKNRGLAFVSLSTAEEAQAAINNIKEVEGRAVFVNYAYVREEKPSVPPKPPVPVTFNLFVANLAFEAKTKDLKDFFASEYDSVHSAEIIYHENPRKPSGYGFVAFKSKKQAEAALTAFEGKLFMRRPLRLQRGKHYAKQRTIEYRKLLSDDSSTELKSDAN